jgi:hypothetical protein
MAAELSGLALTATERGVEFNIKVVPGASRTRIAGLLGTALKLAVSAPPEGGQANDAVVELLAGVLGVRRADVEIIAGRSRAQKRVAVAGLDASAARSRLAASI